MSIHFLVRKRAWCLCTINECSCLTFCDVDTVTSNAAKFDGHRSWASKEYYRNEMVRKISRELRAVCAMNRRAGADVATLSRSHEIISRPKLGARFLARRFVTSLSVLTLSNAPATSE